MYVSHQVADTPTILQTLQTILVNFCKKDKSERNPRQTEIGERLDGRGKVDGSSGSCQWITEITLLSCAQLLLLAVKTSEPRLKCLQQHVPSLGRMHLSTCFVVGFM
jgi:arginine utilization protein RocB